MNLTPNDDERRVHQELRAELSVHKVELEMQNRELQDTQHKLEHSRARYFILFDLAPIPYLVLDKSLTIREANLAAEGLLADVRSHLVGLPVTHFAEAGEKDRWFIEIGSSGTERRERAFDSVLRDSAGKIRHVHLVCLKLARDTQDDAAYLLAVMDVTARVEAERERQKLNQKLLETQKLESLGILAGGIAHDFNNLLTGILSAASLLKAELPKSSLAMELATVVEGSAVRTAELCKQLLAYAGKGRVTIQALRLNAMIADLLVLLKASLPKHHRLVFLGSEPVPPVEGDGVQINQVLMNLIVNASEALGPNPGEVTIRCGSEHVIPRCVPHAVIGTETGEGEYAWVEVQDAGCGMTEETLARIFDPFFTTKFAGRGLGLAAVGGIIRGHKGLLAVESQPGRGTRFKVWLPVKKVIPPAPAPEAKIDVPGSQKTLVGATVLIVDDEPIVRTMLCKILEFSQCRPTVASSGQEAVEQLGRSMRLPDLILVDLTMPGWDGAKTYSALRKAGYVGPIFLMSGYAADDVEKQLSHLGLTGVIQKPIDADQLIERMRTALSGGTID
ncbi:MAG: response regulator [Opitutaceae bacterium]|nr:response regulator [Opitutaceae bacterium]